MIALLAQSTVSVGDRNEAFFRGLRDAVSNTYDPKQAAIFWGCVLAFFVAVAIIARQATRRETAVVAPKKDYLTFVVDLLGLSETERRCLLQISQACNPSEPAAMLLSPANFSSAVQTLEPHQRRSMDSTIRELNRRLFGCDWKET